MKTGFKSLKVKPYHNVVCSPVVHMKLVCTTIYWMDFNPTLLFALNWQSLGLQTKEKHCPIQNIIIHRLFENICHKALSFVCCLHPIGKYHTWSKC